MIGNTEMEYLVMYDAMFSESITVVGHGGDRIGAYGARPLTPGPAGGVVIIHYTPGLDEATKQIARRFATMGYNAVIPGLYWRDAPGASPDDAAAASRLAGGVPDDRLVGDVAGSAEYLRGLSNSNGKTGVIGYCSGGRQAFLAACSLPLDAAVDCYGAYVVGSSSTGSPPDPIEPILHLADSLACPLLGLFGAEDTNPSPAHVGELDRELTRLRKPHTFHSYEGAGHGFFGVDRPSYRVEAANAGWQAIATFFATHLS